MPAILPVVSSPATSEPSSPPGTDSIGPNTARSEGGVSNDTNGPNSTRTQPSTNSGQTGTQQSFGTVLHASVTGTSKGKTKPGDPSSAAQASAIPVPTPTPVTTFSLPAVVPAAASQTTSSESTGANSTAAASESVSANAANIDGDSTQSTAATSSASTSATQLEAQAADSFATAIAQAQAAPVGSASLSAEALAAASHEPASTQAQSGTSAAKGSGSAQTELDSSPVSAVQGLYQTSTNGGQSEGQSEHGESDSQQSQQGALGAYLNAQAAANQPATVTPQTAIASSSVAERVNVVNQIAQQTSASLAANTPTGPQSITVHVSPPHWGDMSVNVTSDNSPGSSGAVTATITTQTVAARDALAMHADDLKTSLESTGIKVDRVQINAADTVNQQAGLASDKTVATSNSQGSGFQQSSGQQNSSQGGQFGSHLAQSNTASNGQGNPNGNHQAFSAALAGDGQNRGNGSPSWSNSTVDDSTDAISSSSLSNPATRGTTSQYGINVLA